MARKARALSFSASRIAGSSQALEDCGVAAVGVPLAEQVLEERVDLAAEHLGDEGSQVVGVLGVVGPDQQVARALKFERLADRGGDNRDPGGPLALVLQPQGQAIGHVGQGLRRIDVPVLQFASQLLGIPRFDVGESFVPAPPGDLFVRNAGRSDPGDFLFRQLDEHELRPCGLGRSRLRRCGFTRTGCGIREQARDSLLLDTQKGRQPRLGGSFREFLLDAIAKLLERGGPRAGFLGLGRCQ